FGLSDSRQNLTSRNKAASPLRYSLFGSLNYGEYNSFLLSMQEEFLEFNVNSKQTLQPDRYWLLPRSEEPTAEIVTIVAHYLAVVLRQRVSGRVDRRTWLGRVRASARPSTICGVWVLTASRSAPIPRTFSIPPLIC